MTQSMCSLRLDYSFASIKLLSFQSNSIGVGLAFETNHFMSIRQVKVVVSTYALGTALNLLENRFTLTIYLLQHFSRAVHFELMRAPAAVISSIFRGIEQVISAKLHIASNSIIEA